MEILQWGNPCDWLAVRVKVVGATYCCGHQWTDEVKPRWLVYHLCLFRDLCRGLLYLYLVLGQGLCPDQNIDACHPRDSDGGVVYRRLCKIDEVCRLGAGLCRCLVDGLCLWCFLPLLLLGTGGGLYFLHPYGLDSGSGRSRSRHQSGIRGAVGRRRASTLPSCSTTPATESGIGGSTFCHSQERLQQVFEKTPKFGADFSWGVRFYMAKKEGDSQ